MNALRILARLHQVATHLLHRGTDIRTVQKLLGHSDVSPTSTCTHVLKLPGAGVRSALDGLVAGERSLVNRRLWPAV